MGMTEDQAREIAFVTRCSGAATLSFILAQAVGLPHPVWAAMTGVIAPWPATPLEISAPLGQYYDLKNIYVSGAVGDAVYYRYS